MKLRQLLIFLGSTLFTHSLAMTLPENQALLPKKKATIKEPSSAEVPLAQEDNKNAHLDLSLRGGAFWKSVPRNGFDRTLRMESYWGLVYFTVAAIYASFAPTASSSLNTGSIATIAFTALTFVFFGAQANNSAKETPKGALIINRILLSAALLYQSEGVGVGIFNTPFRLVVFAMALGIIHPCISAVTFLPSAAYLYKLGCDAVLSSDKSAFQWMATWAIVTLVSTYGWLFLFYDDYTDVQKARVLRTHWQDKILAFFQFVVSGGLLRSGLLSAGTVGAPIVYLLPPVTLWFTLETKMLNHIRTGTPFHPTWWVDGDVPKFHASDKVNVSFGIATALITVVLTSYAFYAIMTAVSFSSLSFSTSTLLWKFLLAHGILFVFHSGIWMIVASSGVPPIGNAPCFRMFPPELPPLIRANPHDCIPMHKFDLVVGTTLLALGAFYSGGNDGNDLVGMALKGLVAAGWLYSVVTKGLIHKKGWGYIAPVEVN